MIRRKIIFILMIFISLSSCRKEVNADILIINGNIYNGEDTSSRQVSIAIKDDKIIFIGDIDKTAIKSKRTIDAKGLIVCPGFIDPHTHADRDLNDQKKSHNKPFLMQGVTTVVIGNDGNSYYPINKYKTLYEKNGIGTNAVQFIGHGTIRSEVMGNSDKKANDEDIMQMQALVEQEMKSGAFGMSTGLFYAPGSYADTEEVIALAKIVARYHGIYDTHLRDESSFSIGLIPAVKEAIEIGRQAKLPIHISHIKCLGADVWNQSVEIIELIERGNAEGISITANQYPYNASATGLKSAVVPRWAESGGKDSLYIRLRDPELRIEILEETKKNIIRRGGPDKLLIVKVDDSIFLGKNLLEISKILKISPERSVYEILKGNFTRVASFNMIADDIVNFMKRDWVVTGSDGNTGHPRKYGSFPRKYDKYVKKEKVIDIATFINGSTSKTAVIFKIRKRGLLKEGYYD